MKKLSFNFFIHPLTVIYLGIALFTGRFSFLFIHLFVALIHELFHVVVALFMKVRVNELSMLPFGFYARLEDVERKGFWCQLWIYIAGPLSIFFSLFLMRVFYQIDLISYYGYQYGREACYIVCFFNLLPIYPLDGGRIMRLFCFRFLEEEKAHFISYILSLITTCFIFYRAIKSGQWVIALFLIISQGQWIYLERKQYPLYLKLRRLRKKPNPIKISKKPSIYIYYDNYCWLKGKMIGEEEILQMKLEKWQKQHQKSKTKYSIKNFFKQFQQK